MFPKIGVKPPKWMVKIMKNPMNKWDDLGGKNPGSTPMWASALHSPPWLGPQSSTGNDDETHGNLKGPGFC